jgi:hypothetical protein
MGLFLMTIYFDGDVPVIGIDRIVKIMDMRIGEFLQSSD